jgi:hypothetical protein
LWSAAVLTRQSGLPAAAAAAAAAAIASFIFDIAISVHIKKGSQKHSKHAILHY